jgi:2-aminoadipate transaminase
MSATTFDFSHLLAKGLPEPAARFTGFPKFNFIGGHNDPVQIPIDGLVEAARSVLKREGSKLAMYNLAQGPQGYAALRDFVVDKVTKLRGIKAARDDVLITSGSGQGIQMVNRLLLERGDTVILEEFSYSGSISQARAMGANVIGAPLDADGLVIDGLARILDDLKAKGVTAKYIYTIPTVQNPTGSILPLDRRHALIALAKKHGVPIFEDECYADLIWGEPAPPALYALAPEQVIHIGSFSKNLAPALRLGYAIAAWPVLSRMIACKSDGGTGALDQMITAEYFNQNFGAHLKKLNATLHGKQTTLAEAMAREFGTAAEPWHPQGGIFQWFRLPGSVDVRKVLKPAADAGISFNAGPEWSCDPEAAKSHFRLCFALLSVQEIKDGVAALARVFYEQTGVPQRSANVENVRARSHRS